MDEQQMTDYGKGAVEALLFISDKPVTAEQLKEAIETIDLRDVRRIIAALQEDYERQDRGMTIVEIAGGFQMLSNPQYAEYVRNFFKTRVKEKLSRPALEALAIAAYRQPVSRADIELIRGVNSDGIVTHLLEKGLIKIVGRKDIPGRPFLYGTTKLFLEYFGLKALEDLPKLEDVSELLAKAGEAVGAGSQEETLFDSNKVLEIEQATAEFGGSDHVHRSAVNEQGLPGKDEEVFEASGDEETNDPVSPETMAQQLAADQGSEEIGDLKRVMDEMSREQPETSGSEVQGQEVPVSASQTEQ